MAVMDEYKQERDALKDASWKVKLGYFWDYYKWHTFGVVVVVVLLLTVLYNFLTKKEDALYVALVNGLALENAETFDLAYAAYAAIDLQKYSIVMDTSMQIKGEGLDEMSVASSQKLAVYSSAGELDLLSAEQSIFSDYAGTSYFCDLREVLTAEEFAQCEPYLYYDTSVSAQDPVPLGIYVSELPALCRYYYPGATDTVMGIPINGKHRENAIRFLLFLTKAS